MAHRNLTEDTIRELASHYTSRGEFCKKDPPAYNKCKALGLLDELLPRLTRKWSEQKLRELASQYAYKADFYEADPAAYAACKKYGLLDKIFNRGRRPYSRYTFEVCREKASHYTSKTDFKRGDVSAYDASVEHKWIDIFAKEFNYISVKEAIARKTMGTTRKDGSKYRTDDEIVAVAKKYTRLNDFIHNNPEVYQAATRRNMLHTFTWLKRADIGDKYNGDTIYAYEFTCTHYAYIGRTNNIKRRHNEHLRDDDPVKQYAMRIGVEVPNPIIKYSGLSLNAGKHQECTTIDEYRANGWHMINTVKGGSIGSLGRGMSIDTAIKRSKRYSYVCEFMKHDRKAYYVLLRHGKLSECTWLIYKMPNRLPRGYWTETKCEMESRKYKNRTEFSIGSPTAYCKAVTNGWITNYTWLKSNRVPSRTWTRYNACLDAAKQCTSRTDFQRTYPGAYNSAVTHNWLNDIYRVLWPEPQHSKTGHPKRAVARCSMDGIIIETYDSITDAAKKTGLSDTQICGVCRGHRPSGGGFRWKYIK